MIIEKSVLETVPTPLDPPPDYNVACEPVYNAPPLLDVPTPSRPQPEAGPSSGIRLPQVRRPPISPAKGSSWFRLIPGPQDAREKEVRTTVLGLVRELVRQPYDDAALSVLDSCAAACADIGVSLAMLLQERSIEGRTPLYWATVKLAGPSSDTALEGERALVAALFAHCTPLTQNTLSEIRLACVAASDNALYQTFRGMPGFGVVSGADRMLVGEERDLPVDHVIVEDGVDDPTAFVANFRFPLFQKRMRAGGKVGCSFIARGRLFKLVIHVPPGTSVFWVVSLSLGEHSAPSHLDSRLLIEDQTPPDADAPSPRRFARGGGMLKSKMRPTISLRMKTGSEKLALRGTDTVRELSVKLEDSLMASSLQYENCPYISSTGTLHARLEAKLARPEADCIIC